MLEHLKDFLSSIVDDKMEKYERRSYDRIPFSAPLLVDRAHESSSMRESEFSVFSQWGDDGIIQFLIEHCDISDDSFVEFGVEDYRESNTRFLLMNDNWRGLVIEMNQDDVDDIKDQKIYWRHELKAVNEKVTTENINCILDEEGYTGEIGILHIDIDGNDYWIWDSIEAIKPSIAIIEYNSVFGSERHISIPYDPDFQRSEAHYSHLFFGASLPAIYELSKDKGYTFVGCNSAGNNAYFVRNDRIQNVEPKSLQEGFVKSRFRESRDRDGELNYLTGKDRIEEIRGLSVYNTKKDVMEKL